MSKQRLTDRSILLIENGQMGILQCFSYESMFPTWTQLLTNIYPVNSLYAFTFKGFAGPCWGTLLYENNSHKPSHLLLTGFFTLEKSASILIRLIESDIVR